MDYISTRNKDKTFSFKEAFLKGLAPDGGLFVPKAIPAYSSEELWNLKDLSYKELASEIIYKFCKKEFSKNQIEELVNHSYRNFRAKEVVEIKKLGNINLLELFHGPTLAFKDIAMQVIGNMYEKILEENNKKVSIVVATSGDTGAAAISAMKNRKNIKIFVLHPHNKISEVQRKFMTTVKDKNVFNIALDSNFDECQKFVKSMFIDKDFRNSINMSGVNSINWSRIVVQIVYYFFAYFRIAKKNEKINFSVPTGNFGDVYSGYVAKKMGLPIDKLIVATNSNDILKRVIDTGIYKPLEVQYTVSPSMDIQVASNFERLIFDICNSDSNKTIQFMEQLNKKGIFQLEKKYLKRIQKDFASESLSEEETKSIIKEIYKDQGILIDPHTAVGVGAMKKQTQFGKTIVLATAHPSKFFETVMKQTGIKPELPEDLKSILDEKEKYEQLPKDLKNVQNYILKNVK